MALIKQTSSSGLRIKPIQPAKYYLEARINSGDRTIFRLSEGTIFFIDVVTRLIPGAPRNKKLLEPGRISQKSTLTKMAFSRHCMRWGTSWRHQRQPRAFLPPRSGASRGGSPASSCPSADSADSSGSSCSSSQESPFVSPRPLPKSKKYTCFSMCVLFFRSSNGREAVEAVPGRIASRAERLLIYGPLEGGEFHASSDKVQAGLPGRSHARRSNGSAAVRAPRAGVQLHADLLRQVLYTPLLRVHVLVQRRRSDLRLQVLT